MIKIAVITGCLGFIGSHLTRKCLNLGWQIRGVDKCTYAANVELLEEFNKYPNFVFEKKDINNLDHLYDCDYVVNCSASSHVGNSIVCSDDFLHNNINGVHHLLELIKNSHYEYKPTLLHFSSDEVYSDAEGYHTEEDLLKPASPYSASKAAADMLILAWNRTHSVPYVIVRPANNVGTWQHPEKLIPKAVKYLNSCKKIPLHDKGLPLRNWLNVADTVEAIITIINNGVKNEIFNIAGHYEQSNIITIEKIIKCYHNTDKINIEDFVTYFSRPGQDRVYRINDDKLQKLGWYPKKNFDEELPSIVEFYRNRFIW